MDIVALVCEGFTVAEVVGDELADLEGMSLNAATKIAKGRGWKQAKTKFLKDSSLTMFGDRQGVVLFKD